MLAPLQGKEILITREKSQSKVFAELVIAQGGIPIEIPLLNIECRNFAEKLLLPDYQWIIFTSANGVHCFFKELKEKLHKPAQFAVVGHKTEKALLQYGVSANFIPSVYNAEVMAAEFLQQMITNGPILIVKGSKSREVLQEAFRKNKIMFEEVVTYETMANRNAEGLLSSYFKQNYPDFITFTSPSTVETFMEMTSEKHVWHALEIPCMCIGTTTEARAKEFGFLNTLIPNQFTIEGMVDSMVHRREDR